MTKQVLRALPAKITPTDIISFGSNKANKRGACAGAFALYKPGMTVAEYTVAVNKWKTPYVDGKNLKCPALNHVKWDFQRGFIDLKAPAAK